VVTSVLGLWLIVRTSLDLWLELGGQSVNSPELFFRLGLKLGLAMLLAVSIQAVRNNSDKLTDKYRVGIAIMMAFMRSNAKCRGNPFTQLRYVAST